jgi:hypothetical protein
MFEPPYPASTWLPYLELALELVRAIAWPAAVFLVFRLYAAEFKSLFPRLQRVGLGGAELDFGDQSKARGHEIGHPLEPVNIQELEDPVAKQFEEKVGVELDNLDLNPVQKEARLVRALAVTQLERSFALAYSSIFASQIQMLNLLNGRQLPKSEGSDLLKDLQKNPVSFANWNIDQFMQYLIVWRFVEETDDTYSITITGRNFLKYLVNTGLSHERPN